MTARTHTPNRSLSEKRREELRRSQLAATQSNALHEASKREQEAYILEEGCQEVPTIKSVT